jgi:phospholipase/carboxylesterase
VSDDLPLLECVERGPENAESSVIWLHGLGADGYDFEPIIPMLGLDAASAVRFVFPHADQRAVTLNSGLRMRAWYDILSLDLDDRSHDEAGIRDSSRKIEVLIGREYERGVRPERIVLAGFSQGGALALHVALRHRARLAGLVALSCYIVLGDSLEQEAHPANAELPVFMGHGTFDPVVPVVAGELARDTLVRLGHAVEWHTYAVPHAVHPEEIRAVGRALNAWLC